MRKIEGIGDIVTRIERRCRLKRKYLNDISKYEQLLPQGGIPITKRLPYLFDCDQNAGGVDEHYFLQDIHAAELISKSGIKVHYDIGSRLEGFIAHLLSNDNIEKVIMLDIRPLPWSINKLDFIQVDATTLNSIEDDSVLSISSLHALEHFGLGRYGDDIDPLACFKTMKAIQRVAADGGYIYVSFPVSMSDKCYFNAHRIFCPNTIVEQFDKCTIEEVYFIHSNLKVDVYKENAEEIIKKRNYNLGEYDCGLFTFKKGK